MSRHHMTRWKRQHPWGGKKAAERGVGVEWGGGVVKSLVFPFLVQSRPAAVVLCIFQTQLNEPGWEEEARQPGRGHQTHPVSHADWVYTVETWPVD